MIQTNAFRHFLFVNIHAMPLCTRNLIFQYSALLKLSLCVRINMFVRCNDPQYIFSVLHMRARACAKEHIDECVYKHMYTKHKGDWVNRFGILRERINEQTQTIHWHTNRLCDSEVIHENMENLQKQQTNTRTHTGLPLPPLSI